MSKSFGNSPALNFINTPGTQAAPDKPLRTTRKQLALTEELAKKATKEAYKREESFNQFIVDLLEDYFSKQ